MSSSSSSSRKLSVFVAMQIASKLSSGAAAFALSLHLFHTTGRADVMAGALAARFGASAAASLVAGSLVDRLPRGRLIIAADLAFAALAALLGLAAAAGGPLALVYALLVAAGLVDAVHSLATQSLPPLLGDRAALVRLNARLGLVDALPAVLAPLVGAAVASHVSVTALFALDALTFVIAAGVTALLRLPRAAPPAGARPSLLADARLGFRRIFADPVLRALIGFYTVVNFAAGLGAGLQSAYILAASGGNHVVLAIVSASGAAGAFAGALASARLARAGVVTTLLALIAVGGAGRALLGLTTVYGIWVVASLARNAALVASNGCNQAIWQSRAAAGELGRVLGARRLLAQGIFPVAVAAGGLIAGAGAGAGGGGASSGGAAAGVATDTIAHLFLICGALEVLAAVVAARLPALRSAATSDPGGD